MSDTQEPTDLDLIIKVLQDYDAHQAGVYVIQSLRQQLQSKDQIIEDLRNACRKKQEGLDANESLASDLLSMEKKRVELTDAFKIALKTLEYYANEEYWDHDKPAPDNYDPIILSDKGSRARAAFESIDKLV